MSDTVLAVYQGTFVHAPTRFKLEILEDKRIYVKGGTIVGVGESGGNPPAGDDWTDAISNATKSSQNEFFFPGLIDTHIHAPQYGAAGLFGESLMDWLEQYIYPTEKKFEVKEQAELAYPHVIQLLLSHGTTTACYFATIHEDSTKVLATKCKEAGQRAFIGGVCMDQNAPEGYQDDSVDAAVQKTNKIIKHCNGLGDLIAPIVTPRFGPTCSMELLKALGKIKSNARDLRIQTHISESKDEIGFVADIHHNHRLKITNYAEVYNHAKLLTPQTVLAHAVHITDPELELVQKTDCGMSHCPVSNLSLTSGMANVKKWVRMGIKVGLGTDLSGGYNVSLLETVRQAILVSNMVSLKTGNKFDKVTVSEALFLATCGGAHVLGIEKKVGKFVEDMQWDAILVGLGKYPYEPPGGWPAKKDNPVHVDKLPDPARVKNFWPDRVHKWVYNGDDRNTHKVWVKGKLVYEAKVPSAQG